MAGNDSVEIQLQGFVERFGPLDDAAAAWVVNERAGAGHQVAGVKGFERREIDDGIAVGVAAAEVAGADFLAAEKDAHFLGEGEACGGGRNVGPLFVGDDVGAGHGSGDDVGSWQELRVAAAVILVVVGGQHVLNRLRGDGFHLRDDGVVVLIEFVVDQNNAFGGDQDADVAAIAFDFVEAVFHLIDGEFRLLRLRPGEDAEAQEDGRGGAAGEKPVANHAVRPPLSSAEGPYMPGVGISRRRR